MLEKIKELREETGAGLVDVKKALEEAGGDMDQAREILKKRGQAKAMKKSDRTTAEGYIGSYVHTNGKLAALAALRCETDFVARTDEFRALARDIAMHITAAAPEVISPEDLPEEKVAAERKIWQEQLADENKPEEVLRKILQGKEEKFRREAALLTQPFVKDPDRTVGDLIAEKSAVMGEKIEVSEFKRMSL